MWSFLVHSIHSYVEFVHKNFLYLLVMLCIEYLATIVYIVRNLLSDDVYSVAWSV